jgi:prepilin-type N-terminal cleavage/methylation domain-containing protein
MRYRQRRRRGFTLVEILMVISIILLVAIIAIPAVWSALNGRQVTDAARIFTGALVGARDAAIKFNEPRGIRLMPDPQLTIPPPGSPSAGTVQLVYNKMLPIEPAGDINDGKVNIGPVPIPGPDFPPAYPNPAGGVYPFPNPVTLAPQVLMVEEAPYQGGYVTPNGLPNSPTNWFWNVRIGDKIKVHGTGRAYTVVGPCTVNPNGLGAFQGNNELYVNVGPPGTNSPLVRTYYNPNGSILAKRNPEFLFLVNGEDDNSPPNGYIDDGFDGQDQNPPPPATPNSPAKANPSYPGPPYGGVDEVTEWETETWVGAFPPVLVDPNLGVDSPSLLWAASTTQHNVVDATYIIQRRPVPSQGAREIALPAGTVIDATTWNTTAERSRLPIDPQSLACDIMVTTDGRYIPTTIYSAPTSASQVPFLHFWLCDRKDVYPDGILWGTDPATGKIKDNPAGIGFYRLPMASDALGTGPGGTIVSGGFYPPSTVPSAPVLKGDRRLVTMFAQSGLVVVNTIESIPPPSAAVPGEGFNVADVNYPFYKAQSGQREAR